MNAPIQAVISHTIGQHLPEQGGHYAGAIRIGDEIYGLILSPKAEGETDTARPWNEPYDNIEGALSFFDGARNTTAMADAGSQLAEWAQRLNINGFADWYLPARDELELLYRGFKPTDEDNYCYRGDNPSSVPVGYAYSANSPARAEDHQFHECSDNAFEDSWYWSSTQCAGNSYYAWCQHFGYGNQYNGRKNVKLRARAVRRFKLQ